MCHKITRYAYLLLSKDLIHLPPGVILEMPDGALVLLLALELEDDGLIDAAVGGDGALHARRTQRRAGLDSLALHHGDDAVEFNFRAHVAGQGLDFDRLAGRDAILFTTGFNHCVHTGPLKYFGWKPKVTTL